MKKQTLGMTIAALRRERGMTQLELAEQMGVTDKAVSKWERDLSCPDINSLPKLALLFGVSVDELMQIRSESRQPEKKEGVFHMATLVMRAVALAMGVAVAVLSIIGEVDVNSCFTMLGVGLACAAISLFQQNAKDD